MNGITNGFKARFGAVLARLPAYVVDRLPDRAAIISIYHQSFETTPNLKTPKSFNEKINWRKLYQRDPRFPTFSDKIAVKALVTELIGKNYVIDTLWTGKNPVDIPFEFLDPPYVIKVNHGSGEHSFIYSQADIDKTAIVDLTARLLRLSHAHRFREWGYEGIVPQILVERMIETPGKSAPDDYKFFVYHGKVHYIQIDHDRYGEHRQNFYTRDWTPVHVQYIAPAGQVIPKPEKMSEMIWLAETLGAQFDFVRVDLYLTNDGIKFGEFTFYPNAGLRKFNPPEWDGKFGEPWELPAGRGRHHA